MQIPSSLCPECHPNHLPHPPPCGQLPCLPSGLSNGTFSWKLLYCLLWVQTVSPSRAGMSLTPLSPGLGQGWQGKVLQGVGGKAGRMEGGGIQVPGPWGSPLSPGLVTVLFWPLAPTLSKVHLPSNQSLLETRTPLDAASVLSDPQGSLKGSVSRTEASLQGPQVTLGNRCCRPGLEVRRPFGTQPTVPSWFCPSLFPTVK